MRVLALLVVFGSMCAPSAQIPAGVIHAPGSHLGYLTAKRTLSVADAHVANPKKKKGQRFCIIEFGTASATI